jgi:hypothetical protein
MKAGSLSGISPDFDGQISMQNFTGHEYPLKKTCEDPQ